MENLTTDCGSLESQNASSKETQINNTEIIMDVASGMNQVIDSNAVKIISDENTEITNVNEMTEENTSDNLSAGSPYDHDYAKSEETREKELQLLQCHETIDEKLSDSSDEEIFSILENKHNILNEVITYLQSGKEIGKLSTKRQKVKIFDIPSTPPPKLAKKKRIRKSNNEIPNKTSKVSKSSRKPSKKSGKENIKDISKHTNDNILKDDFIASLNLTSISKNTKNTSDSHTNDIKISDDTVYTKKISKISKEKTNRNTVETYSLRNIILGDTLQQFGDRIGKRSRRKRKINRKYCSDDEDDGVKKLKSRRRYKRSMDKEEIRHDSSDESDDFNNTDKILNVSGKKTIFLCKHCDKICEDQTALKLHYRKHERLTTLKSKNLKKVKISTDPSKIDKKIKDREQKVEYKIKRQHERKISTLKCQRQKMLKISTASLKIDKKITDKEKKVKYKMKQVTKENLGRTKNSKKLQSKEATEESATIEFLEDEITSEENIIIQKEYEKLERLVAEHLEDVLVNNFDREFDTQYKEITSDHSNQPNKENLEDEAGNIIQKGKENVKHVAGKTSNDSRHIEEESIAMEYLEDEARNIIEKEYQTEEVQFNDMQQLHEKRYELQYLENETENDNEKESERQVEENPSIDSRQELEEDSCILVYLGDETENILKEDNVEPTKEDLSFNDMQQFVEKSYGLEYLEDNLDNVDEEYIKQTRLKKKTCKNLQPKKENCVVEYLHDKTGTFCRETNIGDEYDKLVQNTIRDIDQVENKHPRQRTTRAQQIAKEIMQNNKHYTSIMRMSTKIKVGPLKNS